eukprot:RCo019546
MASRQTRMDIIGPATLNSSKSMASETSGFRSPTYSEADWPGAALPEGFSMVGALFRKPYMTYSLPQQCSFKEREREREGERKSEGGDGPSNSGGGGASKSTHWAECVCLVKGKKARETPEKM